MKAQNTTKIQFDSLSANEAYARGAAAAFLARYDPTVAQLADIKTAVSEAVTNCIVHAYPDRVGPVCMTISVYEDRRVRILIADKGVGIPDIAKAMEPLFTTGDPDERSGLGFAVMQSFMDAVRVTSRPGRGTRVLLTKRLDGRPSSSPST
jgi:stage II sporulation protein AB (anti-sigma F factor)